MSWYQTPPPRRRRRLSDDDLKSYGISFFVLLLALQLLVRCAFGSSSGGEPGTYDPDGLRSIDATDEAAIELCNDLKAYALDPEDAIGRPDDSGLAGRR